MKAGYVVVFTLLLSMTLTNATEYRSGDPQLDRWMVNIDYIHQENTFAALSKFAKQFKHDEQDLIELRNDYEWSIADIYGCLALAKVTGLELTEITDRFQQTRSAGWAKVLKELAVEPGTARAEQFRKIIQTEAPKEDLEADRNNIFKRKKQQ